MLLRSGPMGLLLFILLALNAGAAQPTEYPQKSPVITHNEPSLFQDVAVMWLYVVKESRINKLAFSKKALAESPIISIDGYVNGVVLLSTAPMRVSVDHNLLHPIKDDEEGYFKLPYFGDLSRDDFWSTFLSAGESEFTKKTDRIKGRYSCFAKVPGDALSEAPEFQITMDQSGILNHLTVRQNRPVKLEICNQPPTESNGPDVYYLGNDPEQFEKSEAAFQQRMRAILSGIGRIEKTFSDKIVDQVRIIDYVGPHNAYTCANENQIWLYSRVFWNENVDELEIIAQHETLHILSDRMGLPASGPIREFFAELMGYDAFSRGRFLIVMSGRSPKDDITPNASRLFDFINESNFIRGAKGGHSQDNLDEFCASFLHTLLYIDRLEDMLDTPIKLPDGSLIRLSSAEKNRLANEYRTVLQIVINEISDRLPAPLHTFFHARHDRISPSAKPAIPLESPAQAGS